MPESFYTFYIAYTIFQCLVPTVLPKAQLFVVCMQKADLVDIHTLDLLGSALVPLQRVNQRTIRLECASVECKEKTLTDVEILDWRHMHPGAENDLIVRELFESCLFRDVGCGTVCKEDACRHLWIWTRQHGPSQSNGEHLTRRQAWQRGLILQCVGNRNVERRLLAIEDGRRC